MESKIRKIIREIFSEALSTIHFVDRSEGGGRLNSEYSTFRSETLREQIYKDISFLERIEFPTTVSIGMLMFKGKEVYRFTEPGNESTGRNVWIVIRGNELVTLMFSNAEVPSEGVDSEHKTRTDYQLNFHRLKNYILKDKGGDMNITIEDLDFLTSPKEVYSDAPSPIKDKIDNVIRINGVNWVIDKEKEKIFKKNNPSQEFELLDFIEDLNPQAQSQIYDLLESIKI